MQTMLTAYSITYATPSVAAQLGAVVGCMINNQNVTVCLNTQTLQVAAIDRGVSPSMTVYNDFSNAQNQYAFPVVGNVIVLYNQQQWRTTCAAKQTVLNWLQWFMTDASVVALSNTLSVNIVPSVVMQVANYPAIAMTCNNNALLTSAVTLTGTYSGSPALGQYSNNMLSFYQTVNTERTYTFTANDQHQAINQLVRGEVDVAIVAPDYLQQTASTAWDTYLGSGDLTILPIAVVGVIPTFNLPNQIEALTSSQFNTTLYGSTLIPGISGVALDVTTLSAIYTGNINDWTHPNISQYTPWLLERVNYLRANTPTLSLPITLVICCNNTMTDTTAAQILAAGIYENLPDDNVFAGSHSAVSNTKSRWALPCM